MIYRVTFGFTGNGQGWSETHAMKNSSEDPRIALAAAIAVAEKRVTFLGREFSINVVRVSQYSDDGATTRARGVAVSDIGWTNPVQTVAQAAEPAVVALKMNGNTNSTLADAAFKANTNHTFCGAPPDPAVDNAGMVDPGKSNLGANVAQWINLLIANQFGWLVQKRLSDTEIATITQLGNGKVELVTAVDINPAPTPGKMYLARVRAVNGGVSPLNGQMIVRATPPRTLTSQEIIGLALAQTGGSIRLYQIIQPFAGFSNITMSGRTAEHKRGRPFGASPGRARKRVRG